MTPPDYEVATIGGNESSTAFGDSIGWSQNNQPSGGVTWKREC